MDYPPEKDLRPNDAERAGHVLAGKYRVEGVIGRGGMGVVLAATHLHLGEQVAIKLLLPCAAARSGAFQRFLREGTAAARIRSEHVARIHDAGVLETGQPYLVLEYLKGVDLRTLLRERGSVPVDSAVLYVLQVCEALAEAHALGIIHRDLKPANIFLTRRADGSEAVKVIDFGISKIISASSPEGEEQPLTASNATLGTPNYMAPEQMRAARDVDARADIWALGAVLYALLHGSSPFAGETMVEVYDQILKGAPSLRATHPEIPAALDAVVQRCLRFDRTARYADIGQLAAALAEIATPEGRLSAERALRTAQAVPMANDLVTTQRRFGARDSAGVKSTVGDSSAGQPTSPTVDGATVDVSSAAERPTTAATREPSWHGERASGPTRPTVMTASSTSPPLARARRSLSDRRISLLFAGTIAVAIAVVAAALTMPRPPANTALPASSAPATADHPSTAPSPQAAPPAPSAPATGPSSLTVAAPSSPPPTVAALVAPSSALSAAPRHSAPGSHSAATPPPAAPGLSSAPKPPRVPGLAETPD